MIKFTQGKGFIQSHHLPAFRFLWLAFLVMASIGCSKETASDPNDSPATAKEQESLFSVSPDRLDLGQLYVGATVDGSFAIENIPEGVGKDHVSIATPEIMNVIQYDVTRDQVTQSSQLWAIFMLKTNEAGRYDSPIVIKFGGHVVELPLVFTVLERDDSAPRVLLSPSPFWHRDRKLSPNIANAWQELIQDRGIEAHYCWPVMNQRLFPEPFLGRFQLNDYDAVVLQVDELDYYEPEFDKLETYVKDGGRLLLCANPDPQYEHPGSEVLHKTKEFLGGFYQIAIGKRSELDESYVLTPDERRTNGYLVEHALTIGVHSLAFEDDVIMSQASEQEGGILAHVPSYPMLGHVLTRPFGKGSVVVLSTHDLLHWNSLDSGNQKLLGNLLTDYSPIQLTEPPAQVPRSEMWKSRIRPHRFDLGTVRMGATIQGRFAITDFPKNLDKKDVHFQLPSSVAIGQMEVSELEKDANKLWVDFSATIQKPGSSIGTIGITFGNECLSLPFDFQVLARDESLPRVLMVIDNFTNVLDALDWKGIDPSYIIQGDRDRNLDGVNLSEFDVVLLESAYPFRSEVYSSQLTNFIEEGGRVILFSDFYGPSLNQFLSQFGMQRHTMKQTDWESDCFRSTGDIANHFLTEGVDRLNSVGGQYLSVDGTRARKLVRFPSFPDCGRVAIANYGRGSLVAFSESFSKIRYWDKRGYDTGRHLKLMFNLTTDLRKVELSDEAMPFVITRERKPQTEKPKETTTPEKRRVILPPGMAN